MNKPKRNRRNYIVKPKVGKKLIISTVASVMAVTVAASLLWNAMKVSVPVEANTLSGVSEALKDHGSGEAFVILDIVPGTVSDGVPLGTIGDLTSGQSQLEKYIAGVFKKDTNYSSYDERESKVNELLKYAQKDFYYLESPFSGNGSWIEIYGGQSFDPAANFDETEALKGYWSIVKGKLVPAVNGAYKLVSEFKIKTMMSALEDSSYNLSNEPLYEGYSLESSEIFDDENISQYDNDALIYEKDDEGNYIYISTIADFTENKAERAEKLEEYKEKITENDDKITSYEERIADIKKQYDDINKQLDELIQQTSQEETTTQETVTEDDSIASLNWMKFSGVDSLSDEPVIEGGDGTEGEGGTETEGEGEGGTETEGEGEGEGGTGTGTEGEGEDEGGTGTEGEGEGEGGTGTGTEGEGEDEGGTGTEGEGEDGTGTEDKLDPSEELKQKQEELNKELEELNKELEDLKKEQDVLKEALEKDSQGNYYIAVFQHEIVEEGGEPISGLYIPNKSEPVPFEKTAMFAYEADGYSLSERAVKPENTLAYVGSGKGGENARTLTLDSKGEEIKLYGAPIFIRGYHEDLLKEYVFDDSGLNIKINVKSAADVTAEDIRNADLIYLEDVVGRDGVQYIHGGNDMSGSAVFNIIDRAVNDLTPVIVDYSVSEGGSSEAYNGSNYQKLASILLMTDLYSFFQDMDGNVDNMLMNAESGEYGRKSYTHYVNNNIYVVKSGELSERESFSEEFTDISGFEEVKSAIDMENRQGNNLPGPSKAMAIQYIINYANSFIGDFRDFSILELQPTTGDSDLNTRNDSRDNTILYWRKPGSSGSGQQIVRSRKLITITVDTESVAQFSGEQSDINDKYQMIFIGLDGQSLNYDGNDTAYNDSSLNGKVYSGVGDIADGAGQRYDGIDITPQKKNALLEFMKAGYPIVVENNFFVDKTAKDVGAGDINTDYIDSSSQMYDFLRIALSSDDYKWCLYTIGDIHTHYTDFAAQINVHRPDVEFDWGNAVSELNANEVQMGQIVQTVAADAEGKYRGYIPYKVTDDVGESYNNSVNTRFYLDTNQDGRFDALEEVTGEVAISNGLLIVEFAAPERGIIPWKLEISDTGNGYRRDALTGYFQIAHSTQMPIRIVQVIGGNVEDSLDAKFNFELAYEYDNGAGQKALLGYYLKKSEALTNTKLEIETLTVGQLAEEIKFNEEYLSGADVLVLGFGPDCSLNVPVIDKNVEWYVNKYISEGRGVLVSSAASSEALGRMQLDANALGQKDVKTYNSLGRSKPSSVSYYKYSNLKSDMFFDWDLLSASMVNDGAVSHYPYEVGSGVRLGNTVKIADYVLDLESNGASDTVADVTAWYSLGDVEYFDTKTSYGVSVKDAANNYYIYSKGNVVYVGESGYPYAYDSAATPDPLDSVQGTDNCKLFVNALMEAYNVGIKNPKVTIVSGLSDDSAETDSICIPYDEQIREIEEADGTLTSKGILDDTVDVYFKVSEPNFAFRKDVTIAFYYEDAAGIPVDVGGRIVNATPFASEIWTVDQNQLVPVNVGSGLDLVPGKVYKIKAPVVSLKNDDNSVYADIYIVVQSHFIKLGQDRHPIGSDSVTLNRAQLFLLE